jgi:arabinoxylan arabinofuranohydrolase
VDRSTGTNAYIKVKEVGFGEGAKCFAACVASGAQGGKIELRLDSLTGPLVGTRNVPDTGTAQKWETTSCLVKDAAGVHDLYFVFTGGTGGEAIRFDWWKFE